MRYLVPAGMLILAGCASLDSDLKSAQTKCSLTGMMTLYVTCLNDADEAVLRKDAPDDVQGYRTFAAARLDLAKKLDGAKITGAQFQDGVAQARANLAVTLAQDAGKRQQAAQAQRTQDALQNMKPLGDATGMDNGMMSMRGGM